VAHTIRQAQPDDVPALVALSEERRRRYEQFQPLFWRKAEDSAERHAPFLEQLLRDEQTIALVAERDGAVEGFVIATLVPAPPVYAPGGPTCSIDDYWVAGGVDWDVIGEQLLDEATRRAQERGAVQAVVVCGYLDQPKRAMLVGAGYVVASEWYVKSL
jgi:ribosomal protein S18 acetylase RimI-like enzyme